MLMISQFALSLRLNTLPIPGWKAADVYAPRRDFISALCGVIFLV
jgi:hypothetical protein